ncbi:MAG: winged helix-turn-helix transcriptional regulator [Candidatus Binatia bacterium]
MPKRNNYHHYCPAARALDVIGEKWSLLVVRDLLRGPQRFSDLLRYVGGITPKWLSARLKELEQAGIVERDSESGRREVWYTLTSKGRALQPIVESLLMWGIEYALTPPASDEVIHPEQTLDAFVAFNNKKGRGLGAPAIWTIHFKGADAQTIAFDGKRWSCRPGPDADADLVITTTPEDWVNFVTTQRGFRHLRSFDIDGGDEHLLQFCKLFGLPAGRPVAGRA